VLSKFCLRNEILAAKTLRMLRKVFGDSTMSQKNVYKWYKDFKEGRERVDDLGRSGRPSTSTDDQHFNKVKEFVLKNLRLTVRDLTDMIRISCKKSRRVDVCETMLSDYQDKLKCMITEDVN